MRPDGVQSVLSTSKSIDKLFRLLDAGMITSEECFENILRMIVVTEPAAWVTFLSSIPISLQPRFAEFARSHLVSVDFMPNPGVVAPSANTSEAISAAKLRLRPVYIELLRIIDETFARE